MRSSICRNSEEDGGMDCLGADLDKPAASWAEISKVGVSNERAATAAASRLKLDG